MEKGFTVKFNECGKETVMTNDSDGINISKNNSDVRIKMDMEGFVQIICKCKNEIVEY